MTAYWWADIELHLWRKQTNLFIIDILMQIHKEIYIDSENMEKNHDILRERKWNPFAFDYATIIKL